jgi:protein-arginine kinase activator protein McsA
LEDEVILKQFDEIEKKVERLIGVNKSLKKNNIVLKGKIEQLERELQLKVEAENHQIEAKALIRSKIDGLMVRLDGITEAQ